MPREHNAGNDALLLLVVCLLGLGFVAGLTFCRYVLPRVVCAPCASE